MVDVYPTKKSEKLELVILVFNKCYLGEKMVFPRAISENWIFIRYNNQKDTKEYENFCSIDKLANEVLFVDEFTYELGQELLVTKMKNPESTRLINTGSYGEKICAVLRENYKIPGVVPSVLEFISDKSILKDYLKNNNFPGINKGYSEKNSVIKADTNKFISKVQEKIPFPMFARPNHASCSTGTFVLKNEEELKNSVQYFLENNMEFNIEEFINGSYMTWDCVAVKGKVEWCHLLMGTSYFDYVDKRTPRVLFPVEPETELFKKAYFWLSELMKTIKDVPEDFYDIEFFLKDNNPNDIRLIEVNLRNAGNQRIVQIAKNFNIHTLSNRIDLLCGFPIRLPKINSFSISNKKVATITFPIDKYSENKVLKRNLDYPKLANDFDICYYYEEEELAEPKKIKNNILIYCIVNVSAKNLKDLERDVDLILQWKPYK